MSVTDNGMLNPQVLFFVRLYAKKCLGCSERISADELVMRALDSVFHLRCFICVVCGVRLQRGDQFVIKQGQLFCRPDYEKEVEMLQGYAQGTLLFCTEGTIWDRGDQSLLRYS